MNNKLTANNGLIEGFSKKGMNEAELFRDKTLGKWSSHPYWTKRRQILLWGISFIPLAVAVLIAFYAVFVLDALEQPRWWEVLTQRTMLFGIILFVLSTFMLSALMTWTLCMRLAHILNRRRIEGDAGAERLRIKPWLLASTMALGTLGPFFFTHLQGVTTLFRFLFQLFAVLPILGVLVWMWVMGKTKKDTRKRRYWILAFCAVPVCLLILTLLIDLELYQGLARWPWYESIGKPFLGLLVLTPFSCMVFAVWLLWKKADHGEAEPDETEKTPSLWKRFKSRLKGFLGIGKLTDMQKKGPDAEAPPDWLNDLLNNLPEGCIAPKGYESLKREKEETSNISKREDLVALFGGIIPTEDQAKLVDLFVSSYERVIDVIESGEGDGQELSADILLHGEPGSGKTTSLVACASYAAFVRGQRVLFMAPNMFRAKFMEERLNAYLKAVRLHYYIQAQFITAQTVADWINLASMDGEEQGAQPGVLFPQIIVTTPQMLEEQLYGVDEHGKSLEVLRRFILSIEVMLVDDFMDYSEIERSNIPFILDKQRMLLSAEFLPLQTVVVCPLLAEVGKRFLGERLLTSERYREDRTVLLRPRPNGHAWKVKLEAEDVDQAMKALVVQCLKNGLDTVLYMRVLDETARKSQQQELVTNAGGGSLSIISDLDQPLSGTKNVDAIFYQMAVSEDVFMSLRLSMGNDDTVIFAISQKGEPHELRNEGILPVVLDRSALAIQLQHLRSLLRLLPEMWPIKADAWYQLGIRYDKIDKYSPKDLAYARFGIDEWIEDEYRDRLWPYLYLCDKLPTLEVVDVCLMPEEKRHLYRHKSGTEDYLFFGAPAADGQSIATKEVPAWWKDGTTYKTLRAADMAYLNAFRLVHGNEVFVSMPPKQTKEGIELIAKRLGGKGWQSGDEAYLPIFDIQWDLPNNQSIEGMGGGSAQSVYWFCIEQKRVPIHSSVIGIMSEYAEVNDIQAVRFDYDSLISGMLLAPRKIDSSKFNETISRGLAGKWTTGSEIFRPELTGAFNYALNRRAPGLTFFARVLCFSLAKGKNAIGSAILWLLEPVRGGRTAMVPLDLLMRDKRERISLFHSVLWFLQSLKQSKNPVRFLRRFARLGYKGDEALENLDISIRLIENIIAAAKVSLDSVANDEPMPVQPPDPMDPRAIKPVNPELDPSPNQWDTAQDVTPWEECMDILWKMAADKWPDLPGKLLDSWNYALRILVECQTPGVFDEELPITAPKNAAFIIEGQRLLVLPAGGTIGRDFIKDAELLLSSAAQGLTVDEGTTIIIRIWVLPKEEVKAGRNPRLRDPLNGLVAGGFSRNGLFLKSVHTPVTLPPVLPDEVPSPIQGYSAPDSAPPVQATWKEVFPPGAFISTGAQDVVFEWMHAGKNYRLQWGFENGLNLRSRYLEVLNALPWRVNSKSHFEFICNDPYCDAVVELTGRLLEIYGGKVDTGTAEFFLSFVQAFPYIHDPDHMSCDWPRFPSETLLNMGGDCEDTSITLLAMLRHLGIDSGLLRMPGHIAVGIAGPYSGMYYTFSGKRYYYAETATDAAYRPLGASSDLAGTAELVPSPAEGITLLPVKVLSVNMEYGKDAKVNVTLFSGQRIEKEVQVAAYARSRCGVFETSGNVKLIGAATVPPLAVEAGLIECVIPVDLSGTSTDSQYLDIVAHSDSGVLGMWRAAVEFTIKRR